MAFEVFRRHQKKLLAIFAILAMFSFVVSDSLPKLLSPSSSSRDQPVVTLYGKTIYRSALNEMHERRNAANIFVSGISPFYGQHAFGGVKDRDLVDALILEHEADALGLPSGPDAGREFLKLISQGPMTSERFDSLLARMNRPMSGEQLLTLISDQVRLQRVRMLPGNPLVTPYDVFQTYSDQNERVSAKAVEIPVKNFLNDKIPEPTEAQIEAMYEKYKDVLPDPARESPGFKVPRQIQFEILSIDGNALARAIMDKLTDQELRTAYENRKKEFPARSELPVDLFAGAPELTPPILRPFEDVRSELAVKLAEDRATTEIADKFAKIKDEVLLPFADEYATALDALEEARKKDPKATADLPVPADLQEVARREGLNYERTRLLSREQADDYGPISGAEVGSISLSGGRKFAAEFFDTRKGLYEPEDLIDLGRTRYLVRKFKDLDPHVPPLDEVRSDVSLACKMIEARVLAEKAAAQVADQIKQKGGTIKEAIVDGYRVLTLPAIPRKQSQIRPSTPLGEAPTDTPIPDVPHAGDAFRDAYFGLQPGSVATTHNQPRTIFYVMTLDKREPATFAALYAPYGEQGRFDSTTKYQAARQLADEWMNSLRKKAGLAADWVPPDEVKGKTAPEEA
jgi:peptidyl-prolyl cis-trans isomerase D